MTAPETRIAQQAAESASGGKSASTGKKSGGSKARKSKQPSTVVVRQLRSAAGKNQDQRATLTGLGLKKPGQVRELQDTPAVRGMLKKVGHLVRVES